MTVVLGEDWSWVLELKITRRPVSWAVLVGALIMAAGGGSAAGFGVPLWLAGGAAAATGLIATLVVDRFFHKQDERDAAKTHLGEVLDALNGAYSAKNGNVLGLLVAGQCPAPFRGRNRELRQLAAWCADSSAHPVMMVNGPAGSGKSRLLIEFASKLDNSWVTGWLRPKAGESVFTAVSAYHAPAVILVDDADGREDIVALMDILAEWRDTSPIRIVLLSRSAPDLKSWLSARVAERHQWVVADACELKVSPIGTTEDRQRWFAEAVEAYADQLKVAAPDLSGYSPKKLMPLDQPFVMLQAQALLAVIGAGPGDKSDPRALSFEQLADALIEHEKRRWRTTARVAEWGSDGPPSGAIQERCVAALALLGEDADSPAPTVLRRVPELADALGERLADLAIWLAKLYRTGPNGALRIQPDIIGEWFVIHQLLTSPVFAQCLRDRLTDAQAARALSFLARAVDHMEGAANLFEDFLCSDIRRMVIAAAHAAAVGGAGQRLLDPLIAEHVRATAGLTPVQFEDLDRQIPEHLLLQTHAAIADLTVAYHRSRVDDGCTTQAALAGALEALGIRFANIDRKRDALASFREAVVLYRILADRDSSYQDSLGRALYDLAATYLVIDDIEKGLNVSREAVALYRSLAADGSAEHRANLARALQSLSIALMKLDQRNEALSVIHEAVRLYRMPNADGETAYADLALALHNAGTALGHFREYPDALATFNESVVCYRILAADGHAAHQARLAQELRNLGAWLCEIGESQEALFAFRESVGVYRMLAGADLRYSIDLAHTLVDLGSWLDHQRDLQEALVASTEAVALFRDLADNSEERRAGIATALAVHGVILAKLDKIEASLTSLSESVSIYRSLQAADRAEYQDLLAHSLLNLGGSLAVKAGRQNSVDILRQSVNVLRESTSLYNTLAAKDGTYVVKLAHSMSNLGGALGNLGKNIGKTDISQEALAVLGRAVTLYRSLPLTEYHGLIQALDNYAIVLRNLGDHREAIKAHSESIDTYRELALTDPDRYEGEYNRGLSVLRREYEALGMDQDALLHHLTPLPRSS